MSGRADEEGQAVSKPEYWDERYHTSDGSKPTHEWFKSFDALRPLFESHLAIRSIDSRIVHLGSGDSTIPNDLAILGYRNQLCVDFSSAVVQLMAPNAKDGVEWMQGDVRDLDQIPCGSVDAAFDKGTLDAMIYGSPWNPPDDVKQNASQYMEEVGRMSLSESSDSFHRMLLTETGSQNTEG